MNDLVRVLRGQRIDGRGTDEIMRLAADEIGRLRSRLAEAEKFLEPTGWQKAQDEHNALRARLAEAQEELAQWRATGESVTRNEHDLSARLAEAIERAENAEAAFEGSREMNKMVLARLADKEQLLAEAVKYGTDYKQARDEAVANYQAALARLAETNEKMMFMHNESISLHARLAEAKRDAALGRIAIKFVDRAGDYCAVDPPELICSEFHAAMASEVERQFQERMQRDATASTVNESRGEPK